jgi:hypothetical protein
MLWASGGSIFVSLVWFIVRLNIELATPAPLFSMTPLGIGDYIATVLGILGITGAIVGLLSHE